MEKYPQFTIPTATQENREKTEKPKLPEIYGTVPQQPTQEAINGIKKVQTDRSRQD